MSISVKTNVSAMIALQNLNATSMSLQETQNQISTGLKVSTAKDNASVYAIAQKQRAEVSSLAAVTDSLNRATSIADVASAAGQSLSDLMNTMRQKVVAAMDPSLDITSRKLLNNDYVGLLSQVQQIVKNASFDGANILDGSLFGGLQFIADADATSFITLSTKDMSLGGPIIGMAATSTIGTVTDATNVLALLDTSITAVNSALADIGSQSNQITNHSTFVGKLTDSLNAGIGNLVNADMAAESAKLQALQVQQQLGAQSLSIANQAPQVILSLFK